MDVRKDLTVLYYTSNQEDDAFEERIRARLLDVIGELPLISISHEPINFGYNVCIGRRELSDRSINESILTGCLIANTPLVATAEADCLYPPTGYFDYVPDKINHVYRYGNLYILWKNNPIFKRKKYSGCAQIMGREYFIDRIMRRLSSTSRPFLKGEMIPKNSWTMFSGDLPVVNFKTGNGLRKFTSKSETDKTPVLPYFGRAEKVLREMFE